MNLVAGILRAVAGLWICSVFLVASEGSPYPKPEDLKSLETRLKEGLPSGWKMSYDPSSKSFLFVQSKAFLGQTIFVSGPPVQKSQLGHFWFGLSIEPYLSKDAYEVIKATNAEIGAELQNVRKRLLTTPELHIRPSKGDEIISTDPQSQMVVDHYRKLQSALYVLPECHFENISLRWQNDPQFLPDDPAILENCLKVRDSEEALLEKYDSK